MYSALPLNTRLLDVTPLIAHQSWANVRPTLAATWDLSWPNVGIWLAAHRYDVGCLRISNDDPTLAQRWANVRNSSLAQHWANVGNST